MTKASVLTLLLLFFPATALGQSGILVNRQFGFSMSEPKDWLPVDKKFLTENLKKVDMTEAEVQEILKQSEGSILLFAFTKYPANTKVGVNPTIQARVISTKLERPLTFAEFKAAFIPAFISQLKVFDEHEFLVEPTEVEVGSVKGIYSVSKYVLGTQGGHKFRIRARTYAIPYRNYFFRLSFVDEVNGQDCSPEFDNLIGTIRIGK